MQLAGVLFDGLAFGMLLFLLSVGLSVTLGAVNFVNLAHGAFGMLGGYVAVTLTRRMGLPFLAALPVSFVATGAAGILIERTLFRRLYRADALNQALFTVGLAFTASASAAMIFGTVPQSVALPDWLSGSVEVAGVNLGIYRMFLIAVAVVITTLLVVALDYTRVGLQVRAAVDNATVAEGLGIDIDTVFAVLFAVGCGLAGLGGALAIELVGLDPSFGLRYLIYALVVVSIGGLGSVRGSFVAALLLGVVDVAGKYFLPQTGAFLIYALMVAALIVRPRGLMGRR